MVLKVRPCKKEPNGVWKRAARPQLLEGGPQGFGDARESVLGHVPDRHPGTGERKTARHGSPARVAGPARSPLLELQLSG